VTSYAFPTWGNIVLIEHLLPSGQTVWSQYAHLQQRLVCKGDVVQRGDRIGSIGKGADDRYPAHLHFEIRLKDLPASKWGWKTAEDREQVLQAYAHPTNFINSQRPS
jgi:murein DD-endopeptidase MepM/ murein hydrolase activator NlpD